MKDLLDMVFVASVEDIDADRLLRSVRATFDARATHPLPNRLPAPPESWRGPFVALADDAPNAPTSDLDRAFGLAASFWDPALGSGAPDQRWSRERQVWHRAPGAQPA